MADYLGNEAVIRSAFVAQPDSKCGLPLPAVADAAAFLACDRAGALEAAAVIL